MEYIYSSSDFLQITIVSPKLSLKIFFTEVEVNADFTLTLLGINSTDEMPCVEFWVDLWYIEITH